MYREGAGYPWLYHQSFNMMVDFCIWVLEQDGLQIPPFDAHSDGDGMLRRAGLQTSEWESWLVHIVELQHQQAQILRQKAGTNKGQMAIPHFLYDAHDPPTAWLGTASVKECLYPMWEQYKMLSRQRKKWEKSVAKQWRASGANQRLWTDLQSYRAYVPSLTIYLVEYSRLVEYLIPPMSGILTLNSDPFNSEDFHRRVLHTAECLSLA